MLNVLPCWDSSRIQIKSINKDTFCFHLKLSPPEGPQGGEVTAALITGWSLGLGEAPLSGACWPLVEQGVRGLGVSEPVWCNLGSRQRAGVRVQRAGEGEWLWPRKLHGQAPRPTHSSGWPGHRLTRTSQAEERELICPWAPTLSSAIRLPWSKCEAGDRASRAAGRETLLGALARRGEGHPVSTPAPCTWCPTWNILSLIGSHQSPAHFSSILAGLIPSRRARMPPGQAATSSSSP